MKVIVQQRQSLADVAIQVYGDISGVISLASANNLSVTGDLQAGMVLECPDITFDPYLQEYVRKNRIQPATALSDLDELQTGIFTEQFTKEFN